MKKITLPKQQNYEVSQRLAWEAIEDADFAQAAENSGAIWDSKGKMLTVPLLGRKLDVFPLEKKFLPASDDRKIEPWEIIIALHYLSKSSGAPLTGKLISYKEIPDGRLYWPNFISRTHKIMLKAFAKEPARLIEVAKNFGDMFSPGDPKSLPAADVSIRILALPRVPIIIQMWKSDEEFPPEIAFLFDSSITTYLPTEDITVLTQMLAIKLAMSAK